MAFLIASLMVLTSSVSARPARRALRFIATANSVEGITAKGTVAREGIVAADPRVLPLGTRIHVSGAGPYSGVYLVTDTGAKVVGRKIDIYLANNAEAKRFGKRTVTIRVLNYGDNKRNHREETPQPPSLKRSAGAPDRTPR